MKYMQSFATAGLLACIVGCASSPRVALQEPVGPCERTLSGTTKEGSLAVFSARRLVEVEPNMEEVYWTKELWTDDITYESAHTDYKIYGADGKVLQRVHNARNYRDGNPAVVSLPAGSYEIEAEAEIEGGLTETVTVPVVIEAGQETTVHLEPTWVRPAPVQELGKVVRLPDGRVVGCPAEKMLGANTR